MTAKPLDQWAHEEITRLTKERDKAMLALHEAQLRISALENTVAEQAKRLIGYKYGTPLEK